MDLGAPEPGSEEYFVGQGLSARVRGSAPASRERHMARRSGSGSERLQARDRSSQEKSCLHALHRYRRRNRGRHRLFRRHACESAAIVQELQAGGRRKVVLLSGDTMKSSGKSAAKSASTKRIGGLLPGQKADYVRELKEAGPCRRHDWRRHQ